MKKLINFIVFSFITIIILVILAIFIKIIGFFFSIGSNTDSKKFDDTDKVAVTQVQCHNALKSRTINPKITDRMDYSIMGKSVVVYGTIESQNAYSGTIRQNWSCECIVDEEADTIKLNDLIIE